MGGRAESACFAIMDLPPGPTNFAETLESFPLSDIHRKCKQKLLCPRVAHIPNPVTIFTRNPFEWTTFYLRCMRRLHNI